MFSLVPTVLTTAAAFKRLWQCFDCTQQETSTPPDVELGPVRNDLILSSNIPIPQHPERTSATIPQIDIAGQFSYGIRALINMVSNAVVSSAASPSGPPTHPPLALSSDSQVLLGNPAINRGLPTASTTSWIPPLAQRLPRSEGQAANGGAFPAPPPSNLPPLHLASLKDIRVLGGPMERDAKQRDVTLSEGVSTAAGGYERSRCSRGTALFPTPHLSPPAPVARSHVSDTRLPIQPPPPFPVPVDRHGLSQNSVRSA
ncbi:hypothetical protein GLOTRDRAFT_133645 [Gloeophyllum trabeum ATCC 11539]|uniref:Uncharacterized protein n=1 Tax=Gloeophyllum trabeum (strain ATCC 11539 / FP-39264 / Madison 617) TaxID=670483 RepID=S7PUA1_GLOTA|nr:uncharacterized protein GLOTRDRAFT_133645 [Gloeophyllum trabeum ATCC 11539]EPQ50907.1 hypothetical protein GLOTRDRAFT_133645 [Gloeophyllum trabeum ATCC 11539]